MKNFAQRNILSYKILITIQFKRDPTKSRSRLSFKGLLNLFADLYLRHIRGRADTTYPRLGLALTDSLAHFSRGVGHEFPGGLSRRRRIARIVKTNYEERERRAVHSLDLFFPRAVNVKVCSRLPAGRN